MGRVMVTALGSGTLARAASPPWASWLSDIEGGSHRAKAFWCFHRWPAASSLSVTPAMFPTA